MTAIGPGTRLVCIRTTPWTNVDGEPDTGPARGEAVTVSFIYKEAWWRNEFVPGPFVELVEWGTESIFGLHNFKPLDDEPSIEVFQEILRRVDRAAKEKVDG